MPRPPAKKKITPSFPNLSVAKSSAALTDSPPRRNPGRQASERVSDVSDDSEGLVTTTNRFKRRKAGSEQEATMSGGLGIGDVKYATKKVTNTRQRPAISKVAAKPEHAKALEGLKRRRDAALKAQNGEVQVPSTSREETVAVSDKPVAPAEKIAPNNHASGTAIITAPKPVEAPPTENSVLAIANFKRRPRQPSILRMVQQDSDNDEDASLDDFNPEDESTPLNLTKSRSIVQPDSTPGSASHTPSSSNLRKRKLATPEVQEPRSSPPLPSPEAEAAEEEDTDNADSQDLPEHPVPPERHTSRDVTPQIWSETMAPPQSSSPSHSFPPAANATPHKHQNSKTSKPHNQRKQPSRKAPITQSNHASEVSDNEQDPQTKTPPPNAKSKATKTTKPQPAPTTASLQTLLPRRRRRAQPNEFDIPSSDDIEFDTSALNASDDELTHLPTTKRKPNIRNKKPPHDAIRKPSPKKRITTNKKGNTTKKEKVIEEEQQQAKKTYTRQRVISSDKENNNNEGVIGAHDEGDSSLNTVVVVGEEGGDEGSELLTVNNEKGKVMDKGDKEMRSLARKFKEVDKWQMEFEEVTASSSSPVDAR
ncbi:MAG: hypothetical protein M1812_001286 [Candelaria pacifica]|nr:MAG: hypothetical protein M1812_001286 [Candelaria pacifica]